MGGMDTSASGLKVIKRGGQESRPLVAALASAVYPPDVLASVPWRNVQSAPAEHRVLVVDQHEVVVGAAGLIVREALLDGNTVQIGGVGGVMSMPARQRSGIGRLAMEAVADIMANFPLMRFALLFCESKNIDFYRKLGWRVFDGVVEVQQDEGRQVYNIMTAMVRPVHGASPDRGHLDVCGRPW